MRFFYSFVSHYILDFITSSSVDPRQFITLLEFIPFFLSSSTYSPSSFRFSSFAFSPSISPFSLTHFSPGLRKKRIDRSIKMRKCRTKVDISIPPSFIYLLSFVPLFIPSFHFSFHCSNIQSFPIRFLFSSYPSFSFSHHSLLFLTFTPFHFTHFLLLFLLLFFSSFLSTDFSSPHLIPSFPSLFAHFLLLFCFLLFSHIQAPNRQNCSSTYVRLQRQNTSSLYCSALL